MTFQPDITKPDDKQKADLLVSQAEKLEVGHAELLMMAKHGILKEVDEVYGLSWWIGDKRILGWNADDLRFDVPSLDEG